MSKFMEAFNEIVDRLTAAERKNAQVEPELGEARQKVGEAERRQAELTAALSKLEAANKLSLPKLAELYSAAENIKPVIRAPDQFTLEDRAARASRLTLALDGAQDYCDQIPF